MFRRFLLSAFLLAGVLASLITAGLPPGRPLPDVAVVKPDGMQIPLKQYRGKPLLVVIFSTTCSDCAELLGMIDGIQKQNPALQVIAAAVEPNASFTVTGFIAKHAFAFPIGSMDLEPYRKLTNLGPTQGAKLPILSFIDPKGMIRVQFFGDEPLLKQPETIIRSTVRELLKEK